MSGTLAPPRVDDATGTYLVGRSGRALGDPDLLGPHQRRRRAFSLLLLTLLVPGSAQLVAGNRRLGRFAVRVWLGCLGSVLLFAVLLVLSRSTAITLLGRGWVLTGLQWVLTGYAVMWAVLFVDAMRLGRPAGLVIRARRWLVGLTALLLVVTSGGLVYGASAVGAGRGALDRVFTGTHEAAASKGRFNILLLGGDSGADRVGTRPDSIQLVSVDARTGRAVALGFSRDTENINFRPGSTMARLMPEGWNCGDECLLNGLYTWAENHKAQFPAGDHHPGVTATREAVEALSGLDVSYYVLVDLRGFAALVDAVGGLDVDVQQRTPIGGGTSRISGWIEPGQQHLDGYHALWYARSRQGSTNYERMARQRCVMNALVQQVDPASVVLRFGDIAAATTGVLQTDIPKSQLGTLAELALKTRSQKITSVNFVPPLIKPWDYDPAFVRATVAKAISASEKGSTGKAAGGTARARTGGATAGAGSAAGAAGSATGAARTGTPSAPANADTSDLGRICSAG